jgi:4'-phosphopantetheinyl transferase EntD
MIEDLLPEYVAGFETDENLIEVELFPAELVSMGRPVGKRRREFVTGRACARRALAQLGLAPVAIPNGERGEPLWPAGIVGSITHCANYRGCAVAWRDYLASLGIDAEAHEPLPDGILESVSSGKERVRIGGSVSDIHLDRVLFCAKEAVYKAWFPLTGRWLGFEDVDLSIDLSERSFTARLLVPGPDVDGEHLTEFRGLWRADECTVIAAVAVPRRSRKDPWSKRGEL